MKVRISTSHLFDRAKRILIRGTNWIGDAVMTLPAILAIRKTFPDARISILVKPWAAEVFNICKDIDEVILFQSPGIHSGIRGKLRLAQQLKVMGFDMAILLQNAMEAAIITWLAGIPIRAGYNSDGRGLLLTHSVQRTEAIRKVHQIKYYLEMVKSLGCQAAGTDVHLRPGKDYAELAEKILDTHDIGRDSMLVGVAPGATYGPAKKWFPERFADVADRIIDDYSARVIIFGSNEDRASADQVQRNSRHTLINLVGKTNLKEAIAIMARCNLFISNDSGLMHVAGALNIPTVAIFGSTNPITTSPVGSKNVVIYKGVLCSPCLKETCPTDFRCMDMITVDDVYNVARELLSDIKSYHCEGTDSASARNNLLKKNTAVFLDRDGTLNEEVGYLDSLEKLKLYDNTTEAIRLINESGMKAVVFTNQSGVARGYFTEDFVRTVHTYIQKILQDEEAFIDAFYYCPHHPTDGIGVYQQACTCRKPESGMIIQAAQELNIDLTRSYTVGDMLNDIQAAHNVGAKGILVKTGYGMNAAQKDLTPGSVESSQPDYIAQDILDAVTWIMQDREK